MVILNPIKILLFQTTHDQWMQNVLVLENLSISFQRKQTCGRNKSSRKLWSFHAPSSRGCFSSAVQYFQPGVYPNVTGHRCFSNRDMLPLLLTLTPFFTVLHHFGGKCKKKKMNPEKWPLVSQRDGNIQGMHTGESILLFTQHSFQVTRTSLAVY